MITHASSQSSIPDAMWFIDISSKAYLVYLMIIANNTKLNIK